ncbi:MAG: multicopper oxidase domain-containing protein [Candidatus Thorarchaeota archaeon]
MSKNRIKNLIVGNKPDLRILGFIVAGIFLLGFILLTPQVIFPSTRGIAEQKAGHLASHDEPQSDCGDISDNPVKEMKLTAETVVWEVAPGRSFVGWAFNGTIPGPHICLNEGDTLILTLENRLNTIISFHAHGLLHDFKSDGTFISNSFAVPGGTYTYVLYATNATIGTWAYHDAVAELDEEIIVENVTIPESGEGIERGLFGALIVYPKDDPVQADHEIILVESEFEAEVTQGPTYMTFNGRISPYTPHYFFKLGETIRFRVINVGPNANHDIFVPGLEWRDAKTGELVDSVLFGALEFGDFLIEANKVTETTYICGIPDHDVWGMIGMFTVIE